MEVEILGAEGLPAESVVLMRAGQMRRQAKLSSGAPFTFPSLPVTASPLRVEVFDRICGKTLALSPDAEQYSVRLPGGDHRGDAFAASCLQLSVRDLGAHEAVADKEVEGAAAATEPAVAADGAETQTPQGHEERRAATADKARGYLKKHDILNYVQEMLATLIDTRPDDPYAYMGSHARQWQQKAHAADSLQQAEAQEALPAGGLSREVEAQAAKSVLQARQLEAPPGDCSGGEAAAQAADFPAQAKPSEASPAVAPSGEAEGQVEDVSLQSKQQAIPADGLSGAQVADSMQHVEPLHEAPPIGGLSGEAAQAADPAQQAKQPEVHLAGGLSGTAEARCEAVNALVRDELQARDPPAGTQASGASSPGSSTSLGNLRNKLFNTLSTAAETGLLDQVIQDITLPGQLPGAPDPLSRRGSLEELRTRLFDTLSNAAQTGLLDSAMRDITAASSQQLASTSAAQQAIASEAEHLEGLRTKLLSTLTHAVETGFLQEALKLVHSGEQQQQSSDDVRATLLGSLTEALVSGMLEEAMQDATEASHAAAGDAAQLGNATGGTSSGSRDLPQGPKSTAAPALQQPPPGPGGACGSTADPSRRTSDGSPDSFATRELEGSVSPDSDLADEIGHLISASITAGAQAGQSEGTDSMVGDAATEAAKAMGKVSPESIVAQELGKLLSAEAIAGGAAPHGGTCQDSGAQVEASSLGELGGLASSESAVAKDIGRMLCESVAVDNDRDITASDVARESVSGVAKDISRMLCESASPCEKESTVVLCESLTTPCERETSSREVVAEPETGGRSRTTPGSDLGSTLSTKVMSASVSPTSDIANDICNMISSTVAAGADHGLSMTTAMKSDPSVGAAGAELVSVPEGCGSAVGRPDGAGGARARHNSEAVSSATASASDLARVVSEQADEDEDLARAVSEQVLQESLANQPAVRQSTLSEGLIADSECPSSRLTKGGLVRRPSRQSVESSGLIREFPTSASPESDLARELFAQVVATSADAVAVEDGKVMETLQRRARSLLTKALADGSLESVLARVPKALAPSAIVDVPPPDFDGALDGAIGNMYEELREKNKELRASYEALAAENAALLKERRDIHEELARAGTGREAISTDARCSADLSSDVPAHTGCLETENSQLEQANGKLTEANSKIRAENQNLRSEIQRARSELQ